ncbi:MAG: NADH-quinone oxidoreductase subunit C, partial [Bacteroidota bacterium]
MNYTEIYNQQSIPIKSIPVLSYQDFFDTVISLFIAEEVHCVNYFAYPQGNDLHLICCIADDRDGKLKILSWKSAKQASVPSLSAQISSFNVFEREIHENFGIVFTDHPWFKPLRYAKNRTNNHQIADYPFFQIESEELHEVGVGPIHAGIIEPGHFRFICNGERILHLEIQLGYQHRGVEELFISKSHLNKRIALSESIAGDSATAHASAFAWLWESICGIKTPEELAWQRNVAMEIERIAMHTGDMAAICTDVAYQLGNAVLGRLRTPMVNFVQEWCGNRLGKSLIRPFNSFYAFTPELGARLSDIFSKYEPDFNEMWDRMKTLPSLLSRLEKTGVVSRKQVLEIGAVGMSARMAGVERDIRASHPFGLFNETMPTPITKKHGDVYSRTQLRKEEI